MSPAHRDAASPSLRRAWWADGLRFSCTRCGNCCRGPGNVWVSEAEITALAASRGLREEEFRERYTRRSGRRGVVLRHQRNMDCVFWSADGCSVYEYRPRQCRTYPFWTAIVRTPGSWREEGESCPGVGNGSLHAAEEIAACVADDGIPEHRTRLRTSRDG